MEQPEQKGRVQPGTRHQATGAEQADHAEAGKIGAQQVIQVQGGFPEQGLDALLLQNQQTALNSADTGSTDIALCTVLSPSVRGGETLSVIATEAVVLALLAFGLTP